MISLNLTFITCFKSLNFTHFFFYLVLLKLLGSFLSGSGEAFDLRPWFLSVHMKSDTHISQNVSNCAVDGMLVSFSENYFPVSLVTSSLRHRLFINVLFNFQIFEKFSWYFFIGFKFNFIIVREYILWDRSLLKVLRVEYSLGSWKECFFCYHRVKCSINVTKSSYWLCCSKLFILTDF